MDKVLLIDGMNFIYRANITFGDAKLQHRNNIPNENKCCCGELWNNKTNSCDKDFVVVFNFFRNLRPIIEQFNPDKCFFIMEGHPKFRYDLYSDYKANRIIKHAAKQEDQSKLFRNTDIIVSLLPHLPITLAKAANYEADDVVASLCENLKSESLAIVSTDTDYIQLLQRGYQNIQIYNPIKKIDMEAPTYPYVGWKCLAGDKSDNIPKLLTPKKALDTINSPELLNKFLSVEENRANFNINRQLIEFGKVAEEEIELQEGQRNFQFLFDAFTQMKFESIVRKESWSKYVKTFDCLKY